MILNKLRYWFGLTTICEHGGEYVVTRGLFFRRYLDGNDFGWYLSLYSGSRFNTVAEAKAALD
jgi:hypothetical protein